MVESAVTSRTRRNDAPGYYTTKPNETVMPSNQFLAKQEKPGSRIRLHPFPIMLLAQENRRLNRFPTIALAWLNPQRQIELDATMYQATTLKIH